MYGLCMGFGVHTALFGLIQSGSITEGFKPCWRTGQSARLETILLTLCTILSIYIFIFYTRVSVHSPITCIYTVLFFFKKKKKKK